MRILAQKILEVANRQLAIENKKKINNIEYTSLHDFCKTKIVPEVMRIFLPSNAVNHKYDTKCI